MMDYKILVEVYEKISQTPGRLDKTNILADFFKKLKNSEVIYLLKGRLFPDYDSREIGISEQLTIKALAKSTGISDKEIVKKWKALGDLGEVAFEVIKHKKQRSLGAKELLVEKVLENLRKLPELQGKGTVSKKMDFISELFTNASPLEAKYLTRTILGDLRIGLGDGVIRDAIVYSYLDKEKKEAFIAVQEAYDLATDWKVVFEHAQKNSLSKIELSPGRPLKVMLFPKVTSVEEAFEVVGMPAAFEYKYDGFRMMINKDEKGNIKIFTRRLDEVTNQFPEVKNYVEKHVTGKTFILDGEAVGYNPKNHKYTSFQDIAQRIKRKYDIEKMEKELPIELNIFDIIYYNGKSLISTPFKERRNILEKAINQKKWQIVLAKQIITDNAKKGEDFYHQALKEGEEGVMIKGLNAPYKPGARVGYGVKYKPEGNELDVVIVGAEYGTGKRAGWLTSFDVACRDKDKFLEIGKVSTGFKEIEGQEKEEDKDNLSFIEISNILKPLIKKTEGKHVHVKPEIVITIGYQNIQISPTYESGFALRFPRFMRLRPDKDKSEIITLEEIKKDHDKQTRNIQGLG
jgi:DNA ligase-1